MDALERDYRTVVLADHEAPCVSLYQPTHRTHPDRQQDPIRFRNLVKDLERSLARKYPDRDHAAILRPFHDLAGDSRFWTRTLDGLAIFATAEMFKVYRLHRPVRELAVAADSFHTKPLMRVVQSADRYHVLALSRHRASVFEGNRYVLDEVEPQAGFPRAIGDVVGARTGEPERKNMAYGREGSGHTTRHGTNLRQEATDNETAQFFRAVDTTVHEQYSQPSGMPLLLAALPEHHHLFREVSRNPSLIPVAIDADPAALSADDLRARAWDLVLPFYLERLAGFTDRFNASKGDGGSSDDPAEIGRAAAAGRIATLLVDADRVVPGRFVPETGAIEFARPEDPGVDDLLDDLAEHTLRTGGEVVIVPPDRMPSATGLAAIYRF
jgi:hypothetical protein